MAELPLEPSTTTDIYNLGFDKLLNRPFSSSNDSSSSTVYDIINGLIDPQVILSGGFSTVLYHGKKTFADTSSGYRFGLDTTGTYKWIIGDSTASIDFNVTQTSRFFLISNQEDAFQIRATINADVSTNFLVNNIGAGNGTGSSMSWAAAGATRARITSTAPNGSTDSSGTLRMFTRQSGGSFNNGIFMDASGNVAIGATSVTTSALLDLSSTTGSLLIPRMTTAQRDALTATNGMIIYNSTTNKFQGYEAGVWTNFI